MNNSHALNGQGKVGPPTPAPAEGNEARDPFDAYRRRPKRSFWMLGLQPVEAGDLLSPEHHARILELLPEDGIAIPCAGARGELVFLVSIPEEQLAAFAEGEWRVGHRFEEDDQLLFAVWVGSDEALECPFRFDLRDEAQLLQGAIQLTERQEVDFYGLTHMEEGLMLTLKGSVELPAAFREEVKGELLERLARLGGEGAAC